MDEAPSRVVQRVVFPGRGNLDVVPLYFETDLGRGADVSSPTDPGREPPPTTQSAIAGAAQSSVTFGGRSASMGDLDARRSGVIAAGRRVSFGSYFNAFPAGYWQRWTTVSEVVLRVQVRGECTVVVYRSTAKGHSFPVETTFLEDGGTARFTLPLAQFIDGGWYWFDLAAGPGDVTLVGADWSARSDAAPGRFSIGITTYNRTDMCVAGLGVLADAPDVLDLVDRVYVVDQGSDRIVEHPGFDDATKGLDGKLTVIDQPNLGGSGGFSRAMDETVRAGDSDYVLLLDDDVVTEPESMLRALAFADLARRPTIVGGHMFSLYDRSVLHAFGETVARYNWWWGSAPQTRSSHDFGRSNLRHTPWLHRRIDVDYNGWWMCLLPTSTVRELGLALPVFIKWDDAEYGLRAGRAGVPTVSMPGVAVWHVPWQDKNDAVDWQSYYHLRNRLVAALLHSPYPRGGSVVTENAEYQVRHLLAMQYSTARLRLMALEDVLAGPEHLHRDLATKAGELRALGTRFADSRLRRDLDEFPTVHRVRPPRRGKQPTAPTNKLGLLVQAALGVARQARPASAHSRQHPEAMVASQDAEWWMLSNVDSALVSAADGTHASWYQRDPATFAQLARDSARLHARLLREWPQLARRYRDAAAGFTSPEQWRGAFEPMADAAPAVARPRSTGPAR